MEMSELVQRWREIRQQKYRITFITILTVFFALGLINNFIRTSIERNQYTSSAKLVEAKVLSFSSSRFGKSSYQTNATIQYQTADGKLTQAAITDYGRNYIYAVGQTIRVYYLPENPGNPMTEEEFLNQRRHWLFFGVLGLISLFLTYLASKGAFDMLKRPT